MASHRYHHPFTGTRLDSSDGFLRSDAETERLLLRHHHHQLASSTTTTIVTRFDLNCGQTPASQDDGGEATRLGRILAHPSCRNHLRVIRLNKLGNQPRGTRNNVDSLLQVLLGECSRPGSTVRELQLRHGLGILYRSREQVEAVSRLLRETLASPYCRIQSLVFESPFPVWSYDDDGDDEQDYLTGLVLAAAGRPLEVTIENIDLAEDGWVLKSLSRLLTANQQRCIESLTIRDVAVMSATRLTAFVKAGASLFASLRSLYLDFNDRAFLLKPVSEHEKLEKVCKETLKVCLEALQSEGNCIEALRLELFGSDLASGEEIYQALQSPFCRRRLQWLHLAFVGTWRDGTVLERIVDAVFDDNRSVLKELYYSDGNSHGRALMKLGEFLKSSSSSSSSLESLTIRTRPDKRWGNDEGIIAVIESLPANNNNNKLRELDLTAVASSNRLAHHLKSALLANNTSLKTLTLRELGERFERTPNLRKAVRLSGLERFQTSSGSAFTREFNKGWFRVLIALLSTRRQRLDRRDYLESSSASTSPCFVRILPLEAFVFRIAGCLGWDLKALRDCH